MILNTSQHTVRCDVFIFVLYRPFLLIIAKCCDILTTYLQETFEKFKDGTSEISSMTEITAFTLGFKLGLRLTAEAFIGGNSEQELISE